MATNIQFRNDLEERADRLGAKVSENIPEGNYVAAFWDDKNQRIVINVYPADAPDAPNTVSKLKRQITMNGATVFSNRGKCVNTQILEA